MQTVSKALAGAVFAGAALLLIAHSGCRNQSQMESSSSKRTPRTSRPSSWDEEDEWADSSSTKPSKASSKRSRVGSGFRGREYLAAADEEEAGAEETPPPPSRPSSKSAAAGRASRNGTQSGTGTNASGAAEKTARAKRPAPSEEEDSVPGVASSAAARGAQDAEEGGAGTAPSKKATSPTQKKGSITPATKKSEGAKGETAKATASRAGRSAAEPSEAEKSVAVIVQQLQDPLLANTAVRRIWEAPRALIPQLVKQVENAAPSKVERIQVVVTDPDFDGESSEFVANRIRGLGKMEMVEGQPEQNLNVISQGYDKLYYGKRDGHYRVVMEKTGGFPVGVVVRAGLLNRIQSDRYPAESDDDVTPGKLIEWWREYAELAAAERSNDKSLSQ